jgi:hypothetical protein
VNYKQNKNDSNKKLMNWKPCPKSPDGRHNFVVANGDCFNGCGINQAELSGQAPKKLESNSLTASLNRIGRKKEVKGIHSELHDLVARCIQEFHEPKTFIVGGRQVSTFGYYLGKLKKVPVSIIYMWISEIRQSTNIKSPSKVFWYKYKKWKEKCKGGT